MEAIMGLMFIFVLMCLAAGQDPVVVIMYIGFCILVIGVPLILFLDWYNNKLLKRLRIKSDENFKRKYPNAEIGSLDDLIKKTKCRRRVNAPSAEGAGGPSTQTQNQ